MSGLTNLQYLELSRNEISDIASLEKLTQLSALYLSGNRISNINAIQNLHKFSSLYLDGNKVSDLKPLVEIRNLSSLDLSGNQSDLKSLVVMAKKDFEGEKLVPYLFLSIHGNPLNAAAKAQLAELKGYGVRLEPEEPTTISHKSDAQKATAGSSKKKASTQTKK